MSQFTFDCFPCEARLETNEISDVVEFGKKHADCEFANPSDQEDR